MNVSSGVRVVHACQCQPGVMDGVSVMMAATNSTAVSLIGINRSVSDKHNLNNLHSKQRIKIKAKIYTCTYIYCLRFARRLLCIRSLDRLFLPQIRVMRPFL